MKPNYLIILFFLGKISFAQSPIRYVALGDSYTICTGANANESWPVLLTKHLKENKINIELIANPSHNGFTTIDLIEKEFPIFDKSTPTFVTLLIGVNDWVQGYDVKTFQSRFIRVVDHIQEQLPDKSKLVIITIPDFGVTPTGKNYYSSNRDISKGLAEFNKIIVEEANKRKLKTVDLFEISKEMDTKPELMASDELHPSAKEYAIWETLIYPVVYSVLK